MKRIPVIALAAFALFACRSTETSARAPAKPALWKIADKDTTIYLFGTIHLLPKDLKWQTPQIRDAMAASQTLVLETVMPKNGTGSAAIIAQLGVSPNLPPLADRVAPDRREALNRAIQRSGVPAAALDRFETWAAALMIASASFKELNVDPAYGAEPVLTKAFELAKKRVMGLETPAQQLGFFDGLPEEAQRMFLNSVADDETNMQAEFDKMIAAWGTGNTTQIAATFDDELKTSKALTDTLLRQRNRNWSRWITDRMNAPGTVFVAVGAGHLAGEGSVNALLSEQGFTLVRVQ